MALKTQNSAEEQFTGRVFVEVFDLALVSLFCGTFVNIAHHIIYKTLDTI